LEGKNVKEKMADLEKFVSQILEKNKIPILIGGEDTHFFWGYLCF